MENPIRLKRQGADTPNTVIPALEYGEIAVTRKGELLVGKEGGEVEKHHIVETQELFIPKETLLPDGSLVPAWELVSGFYETVIEINDIAPHDSIILAPSNKGEDGGTMSNLEYQEYLENWSGIFKGELSENAIVLTSKFPPDQSLYARITRLGGVDIGIGQSNQISLLGVGGGGGGGTGASYTDSFEIIVNPYAEEWVENEDGTFKVKIEDARFNEIDLFIVSPILTEATQEVIDISKLLALDVEKGFITFGCKTKPVANVKYVCNKVEGTI